MTNSQSTQLTSNPLYSPTKAAREWAQRRGRADDAMLIEAWTTGWNSRCIPEEPGALADHLRSMLLDGTVQCPLCGKTGPHPHSPEEIVIYRNGVKYGRSLKSASDEPRACASRESDWCCTHCGRDNDPSETHCVHCEWSRKHTVAGVLHERGCEDNPCRCGALKSRGASRDASSEPSERHVDWEAEYKKLAGVYTREGLEKFIADHWPGNVLADATESKSGAGE